MEINTSFRIAEAQHTLDRGSMQIDWVLNEIESWLCMPPSHSSAGRAKVCNWKSVKDHLRSRVRITVAGHFYDITFFFFFFRSLLSCAQSGGDEGNPWLVVSCGGDEALGLYDASHLKFVRCKHLEYDVYPGMYGNVWSRVTSRAFV